MRTRDFAIPVACLMIGLIILAPTASATSTLFFEDWESSIIGTFGTDYCTVNPTTSWVCYDSITASELRTAGLCSSGHGSETQCLDLAANNNVLEAATAPSMGNSWDAPDGDSTVFAEFKLSVVQAATGNFQVFRLTDVSGNEVLALSFKNANAKLEVTNDSQANDYEEINYDSPNAFRQYKVDIDHSAGTYDLTISTIGGTQEFQKLNIPYLSTSDGKPNLLRIGSLSTNDLANGFWDWIKVVG